ncbi:unnamed protein product [Rotaria sp. Silwood2]|nr:unnamed protein product [Rotaria sp. Silwood2]CAF3228923.1 unnamed protein product [Rotaria sp. Silwood2]CAF3455825.1 unnamed protein product [Rotaria sp. Silwood2]CAF4318487.1 unnamed protein product [Rotaria sp. Silwood2]CAF4382677.1 unnamed protein product [Rotaria sp. Silwood2]
MTDTGSDHKYDDDDDENSAEYSDNLIDVGKKLLTEYVTPAFNLSPVDVSSPIGGVNLNAGLDGTGINTSLEHFKLDSKSSCLENINDTAKEYSLGIATSTLEHSSPDISYSIGGVDINAGLDSLDINTPLEDFILDPTSSFLENVNDIAKEYLIDMATSTLSLSLPDVSISIGGIDLNVGLDEIDINTPLGNFKLDPKASCTENLTDAVTELLDNSVNEDIDNFWSDFNDAARIEIDSSIYSDGTTSLLSCQINADTTIGQDGVEANAQADGSLSKYKLSNTDISFGEGQIYVKASIRADGVQYMIGGELNAVSLKNENIQANIGLSVKTGVDLTAFNAGVSVVGFGVNVGTEEIGISTPIGGFNTKF